jgi:hypothetical protein
MGLGQLFLEFFELTAIGALTVFVVLLALRFGLPRSVTVATRRTI